ncbi:glutamate receptor ionotropic, kainate 1-like [Gigantopelta aegis]|uniref:glutamate receptor ionotropic, kainate 1-like n=1 Tax=Gigantopelta aegis TaxID=1735272 RepID=UPI001B88B676|nr:glutamate receptor ionotropic, kainate 1-like [Gigantopelta aegis]
MELTDVHTRHMAVCVYMLFHLSQTTAREHVHNIGFLSGEDDVKVNLMELIARTHHATTNALFLHDLPQDEFNAYAQVYDDLKTKNLSAVIGPYNKVFAAVTDTLKILYCVTSISPANRKSARGLFEVFPEAKVFARAVSDLTEYYAYTKIAVISDSLPGSVVFEKLAQKVTVQVTGFKIDSNNISESTLRLELKSMRDNFYQAFVIVCNPENTDKVLRQGVSLSMFANPNKWLLVNTGLVKYDLDEYVDSRANLTVLRLMMDSDSDNCDLDPANVTLQSSVLHDAITLSLSLSREMQDKKNRNRDVRKRVNKLKIHGCTGLLEFSGQGKRKKKYLQLMTLQAYRTGLTTSDSRVLPYQHQQSNGVVSPESGCSTGTWSSNESGLYKRVDPSKTYSSVTRALGDVFGHTPLRVTTKIEPPFVQLKKDHETRVGNDRFEGHLVDVLMEIANILKFQYNITQVPDGKFGSLKSYGWTGMIRELVDNKADIALAPFQMSPIRSTVVDFTKPFMTKGTTVVIKKPEKRLWIFQFLSPLSKMVWSAIFVSFVVVSLALFGVSRVNRDRSRSYSGNLIESLWYIWGTLLRGSLTGAPVAISSRVVSSAWWFFTLIIISLYTANLAAFLTITISNVGIHSAADLAYQDYYDYGTVDDSQIEYFFNYTKMTHYAKMWAHMSTLRPQSMVRRVENGFERVRLGKYAFIWDSPTIRHEISADCDLMEIGHPFDLKGYGIATRKNAPFGEKISLAILKLNDNGIIYRLEGKWWRRQNCPDQRSSADTKSLDFQNVAGMFLVLLAGIILSSVVCLFQYCLRKSRTKKKGTEENDVIDEGTDVRQTRAIYDNANDFHYYGNVAPKLKVNDDDDLY